MKVTYRASRRSGSLERQMVRLMKGRPGVRLAYRIELVQLADLELTLADDELPGSLQCRP